MLCQVIERRHHTRSGDNVYPEAATYGVCANKKFLIFPEVLLIVKEVLVGSVIVILAVPLLSADC